MVYIKNISYSYSAKNQIKQKLILDNISFDINDGEFVSILGRSGCGKTTLVNIIAGYLIAENGKILINNSEVKKPGKNRIVVNQENDLFDWMTVEENLRLVSSDQKAIDKYLDLVGLHDVKKYFPNDLSGGMKKRLSLARALVVNPNFLILDEPFASLDHRTREELHLELAKIFSVTKKTTLLVTHDLDEAIFFSDRIIILSGKPASILNELNINLPHPRNLDVKNIKTFTEFKNKIKNIYV